MKKYLALSVLILLFLQVDLAFPNTDSATTKSSVYKVTAQNKQSASCHGTDMAITGGASCPETNGETIDQLSESYPFSTGATSYPNAWAASCVIHCNGQTTKCKEAGAATITVVCGPAPNGAYVVEAQDTPLVLCNGNDMAMSGGATCPQIDTQTIGQLYISGPLPPTSPATYPGGWTATCVYACNGNSGECQEVAPETITVVCIPAS